MLVKGEERASNGGSHLDALNNPFRQRAAIDSTVSDGAVRLRPTGLNRALVPLISHISEAVAYNASWWRMEPLLTGFMNPIRPKEMVSPSVKSDELFLLWLSDRKTKEFIVQLASQVDGETESQSSSSSSKKHSHTPKKADRALSQAAPTVAAPLYSLTSNRYPLSFLRRASSNGDPNPLLPTLEKDDSSLARSSPASQPTASQKSSKSGEIPKESSSEGASSLSSSTGAQERKSSSGPVPQLSLSKITVSGPSTATSLGTDALEPIFERYYKVPPAHGLDTLVEELLMSFHLPRVLFFPLKFRLLSIVTPMASIQHQHLSSKEFVEKIWSPELAHGDSVSRLFHLLKEDPKRSYLVPSDWIVLLLGLLEEHPGLNLIKGETEYQERYIEAVIVRLHFAAARRNRTKITLREFRAANIAASIEQLDQLVDVTRSPRFFDYMSYFVIYSNFTELDQDKDWMITKEELASYNHHALSTRIIDRAFFFSRFLPRAPHAPSRRQSHQFQPSDINSTVNTPSSAVTHLSAHSRSSSGMGLGRQTSTKGERTKVSPRGPRPQGELITPSGVPYSSTSHSRFSFMDFVWFILAEEDKNAPAGVSTWFNCLDRDEDGYLSPQDLFSFYEEQLFRMEFSVLDIVPFEDALSQIIDMVKPANMERISLNELRNSGFASDIFDLLFNLQKFLVKDRVIALEGHIADREAAPISSWDSFANSEYLAALGEISYGDEVDEWDDENLDIWVEVATEHGDSESLTNSTGFGTPRDVQV